MTTKIQKYCCKCLSRHVSKSDLPDESGADGIEEQDGQFEAVQEVSSECDENDADNDFYIGKDKPTKYPDRVKGRPQNI